MQAIWAAFRLFILSWWLAQAGVPPALWPEFAHVAACESNVRPESGGDYGNSLGIMQIQWGLWSAWAGELAGEPHNPADNIRLAYLIQEGYSLPRGLDRWDQWTAKPHWPVCRERLAEYLVRE